MSAESKVTVSLVNVPNVCVLLATYNGSEYLQEQLDTIREQKGCRCTVFAQDDGSTDGTVEILSKNQVVIFPKTQTNLGPALNFFLLLKNIVESEIIKDFDFVAFSDQDDVWMSDKLLQAISELNKGFDCYSSSFFEYTKSENAWGGGRKINKSFEVNSLSYLARSPGPGFTYVMTAASVQLVVNDSTFQRIISDRRLAPLWHDWALFAFAFKLELKWKIDHKAKAYYRLHEKNHTGLLSLSNLIGRFRFVLCGDYIAEVRKIAHIRDDPIINCRINRLSIADKFFFISSVRQLRCKWSERLTLVILFLISTGARRDELP